MSKRLIGLHCFNWTFNGIKENAEKIKESGYDYILVSPVQGQKEMDWEWWKLYQPLGFRFIDNILGTKEEYESMIKACNDIGLKVVQDVVLRHTASCDTDCLKPHCKVDDEIKNRYDFYTHSENNNGNMDRWHTTHDQFGLPMVDYNNKELQEIQREFLHYLKSVGVSGVRVDMGKHFALPSEGSDWWNNVILAEFKNGFNFAECIDCDKYILDQYTQFIKVFSNRDCSDKSKMISFIMSHDTEETWLSTKNKTRDIIINEWRWLLQNNKESDMLFYPRKFDDLWCSDIIKEINKQYK